MLELFGLGYIPYIVFKSKQKFLHTVGLIRSRYSLTIEEYTDLTGFDPVAEYCRRRYLEHLELEMMQKEGLLNSVDTDFDKFYDQTLRLLSLDDQKRPILE